MVGIAQGWKNQCEVKNSAVRAQDVFLTASRAAATGTIRLRLRLHSTETLDLRV